MKLPFNYLAFGTHSGLLSGVLTSLACSKTEVGKHISTEAQVMLSTTEWLMDVVTANASTVSGYDASIYRDEPKLMRPNEEHITEICNIHIFTYGCSAFLNGCKDEDVIENVRNGIGLSSDIELTNDIVTKYLHYLNIEYVNLLQSCLSYLPRDTFGNTVMRVVNKFNANGQITAAHVLLTTVINFYIAELFKAKMAHRIINDNGYHEIVPWGK